MLVIRLLPMGKTHALKYRVVVVESKTKLTRNPKEVLGSYEPHTQKLAVAQDRLTYWLKVGAQPSAAIRQLCKIS